MRRTSGPRVENRGTRMRPNCLRAGPHARAGVAAGIFSPQSGVQRQRRRPAMHRSLVVVLAALAALPALPQTVTLPLDQYDKLRESDHPENVTVVDTLLLAGSFKNRNLTATFTGKSVGKRAATAVLQASSGLLIWGCSGTAVIS